jgi:hypothetical protein
MSRTANFPFQVAEKMQPQISNQISRESFLPNDQ